MYSARVKLGENVVLKEKKTCAAWDTHGMHVVFGIMAWDASIRLCEQMNFVAFIHAKFDLPLKSSGCGLAIATSSLTLALPNLSDWLV